MNKKKLVSVLSAVSVLAGCMAAMPASAADNEPIINVTFDDGSDGYTLQNGASLEESSYGRSLSASSGKYADINDVSAIKSLTGDFTFAVLLNPSSDAQWTRAYDIGTGTDSYVFLAPSSSFGAGMPRFAIKSEATKTEQALQGTKTLGIGEWNSVIVTRDNGTTTMYVNGEAAGETTDITYDPADVGTTANNWLGRSQYDQDPYFTGLIDDFRVYDSAVGAAFVTEYDKIARSYEKVDAVAKRNQLIYKNNCFIADTHFYSDGKEVFSLAAKPASDIPANAQTASELGVADKKITSSAASFKLIVPDGTDVSNITAYAAVFDGSCLNRVSTRPITMADITSDIVDITFPVTVNENETAKLFVWDGMKPVPESELTDVPKEFNDVTVVSSIMNYTTSSGTAATQVYAVSESGTETEIGGASASSDLASLDEKDLTITIPGASIPSDTEKLIIKLTTPTPEGAGETAEAATIYCGIESPVAAPADTDSTTNGAHDPSIVKFPDDDTYYVYSSHHLLFTSEDLINWKKYDFTNIDAKDISPKSYSFISSNYANTTMNGTFWAPDVIYVPERDAAHPYWMYISISCGLGGRNSVISLVKSDNPLFWADPSSNIIDAGVVFATKEASGYITNAIDANIYTDTDGTKYFIWGSFWGGIQMAKLTQDGFVDGIDYTSDSTILNTCRNFGTSIFTQKDGVAGPEGAWMHENGDYRYLFTSYGWLGSNYNTRVARSPLTTSFGTNTSSQLLDANGIVMGTQYSKGSTSNITGYKLIGGYRLGDGSMTVSSKIVDTANNIWDYYYERETDAAHVYYGPGHNSAITADNGEAFYCSHMRKDDVEGAAVLQIRKMLYTADGWPVVSPVTYAGEIEQILPEDMLLGTYDLASVGQTKMIGASINTGQFINRNYDIPVLSSEVTLNADHTLSDGLGTWSFDGDHTVTLTFAKDGDSTKDEFYKNGDVMTLYALYGYDKDKAEPVVALTGTDKKHVAQFAKKSMSQTYRTPSSTVTAEPISIAKSTGGNPELGFDADGNTLYGGDPAATVIGDTVYLIVGHDVSTTEAYNMPNWALYTSQNMTDWEYKGIIMEESSISWVNDKTSAWASQMIEHNGKYYLYYCAETKHSTYSGKSIGVAVANKPEGPYEDIGKPLVVGSFTEPSSSDYNDIDPTVWIETTDGVEHRYLAWGNGKYYICELNDDMISIKDRDGDGEIIMHKDIKERRIKSLPSGDWFTEAPWIYRRQDSKGNYYGKYYLFFAKNWREEMAYAMTDDLFGRYDYIQTIMPPTATSNTNHPSVIDFNGKTYFIYHNGALPHGSGFRRSVCIQELEFDENGYVYPLTETSVGLTGTASTIKTSENKYLGHDAFRNPSADGSYPISVSVTVSSTENEYTTAWEIMPAKAVPAGENADNYVSIQSVDKPGLYISVSGGNVTLTQDADGKQGTNMTFKTVRGLDGKENSVSFESVSEPGKYLTSLNKSVMLSYGSVPADASFTIDTVSAKPSSVINVAEKETDPVAEPDITQSFDQAEGVLISGTDASAKTYTALNGVTLYIGNKAGDNQLSQNFSIKTGGVSGNALVLNAGKYQSASRGGRMAIYTPVIPDGYTVTAEFKTKLVDGSGAAKLYYNDSTSSVDANKGVVLSGTTDTELTADSSWHTVTMTITNNADVYTRVISVDGSAKTTDYVNTFPVFWGTIANSTGSAVYFDNLTIKTTTESGETPVITLPAPAAVFNFDGSLADAIGSDVATLTGSTVSAEATSTEASYVEGASGEADDMAVAFSGAGSYGVAMPVKPDGSSYTISFDAKITAATQYSPFVFMANFDGTALKGGDTDAQWISIAPMGWQETLSSGPMIWSRNVPGGMAWIDLYTADNNSLSTGTWHNITIAAKGAEAKIYVDKALAATGSVANIIDDTTKMYLGVNNWDTPYNGAIDNFMLFNETLTAAQIALIGE